MDKNGFSIVTRRSLKRVSNAVSAQRNILGQNGDSVLQGNSENDVHVKTYNNSPYRDSPDHLYGLDKEGYFAAVGENEIPGTKKNSYVKENTCRNQGSLARIIIFVICALLVLPLMLVYKGYLGNVMLVNKFDWYSIFTAANVSRSGMSENDSKSDYISLSLPQLLQQISDMGIKLNSVQSVTERLLTENLEQKKQIEQLLSEKADTSARLAEISEENSSIRQGMLEWIWRASECEESVASVRESFQKHLGFMSDHRATDEEEFSEISLQLKNASERLMRLERSFENLWTNYSEKLHERTGSVCQGQSCFGSAPELHAAISQALDMHIADQIGLPDFALESAGGRIYRSFHSDTCDVGGAVFKLWQFSLVKDLRTPRAIINPEVLFGSSWPMKGSSGYVVIKLSDAVYPTMFTLDHLPRSLDKYTKEAFLSAPREFEVYAWMDGEGHQRTRLGSYVYERTGSPTQTFKSQVQLSALVSLVELRVLSNYGSSECTRIYRFRVHGQTPDWLGTEDEVD